MLGIEQVTYKHFGLCCRLFNDVIEPLVTDKIGPRIIRFGFIDAGNKSGEVNFALYTPGHGTWGFNSGHRVWRVPEDMIRRRIVS